MIELKKAAQRNKIKFIDRVGIVDFLINNGIVAGALGYGIEDGEEYVFNARAVVVANGDQNYRCMPMWACTRGEGLAAAWRAGAEMTNCEFSTFFQWTNTGFFAPVARSEDWIFNNEGENIGVMHRTPIICGFVMATLYIIAYMSFNLSLAMALCLIAGIAQGGYIAGAKSIMIMLPECSGARAGTAISITSILSRIALVIMSAGVGAYAAVTADSASTMIVLYAPIYVGTLALIAFIIVQKKYEKTHAITK